MQSTARGTDVRRRGSASAIQHLADRTFGKVAELSSQVTEDVETALIAVIVASEIRLPDHPEDRAIRVSSINAWTAGATSIYISTSSWEAPHAHLLSRVPDRNARAVQVRIQHARRRQQRIPDRFGL